MDLDVLLGKPPKMVREARTRGRAAPARPHRCNARDAAYRCCSSPRSPTRRSSSRSAIAPSAAFARAIRWSVPWQVPVADVAATLMDYDGYAGEAMAIGERTPLALIDAPASGRMAVAEAITNIAAAGISSLSDVKLSANWMAPAGHGGDDAALYDTVRAVALELCPALGISIPVGKDSMSMRTTWRENGVDRAVTAPLSLIVSAFAPVPDVRRVLTPLLATDRDETALIWIDLGVESGVSAARRSRKSTVSSAMWRRISIHRRCSRRFSRRSSGLLPHASSLPITTSPTAGCSRRLPRWRLRLDAASTSASKKRATMCSGHCSPRSSAP
jgi:phosphoribosylformylglycinamidine synthase